MVSVPRDNAIIPVSSLKDISDNFNRFFAGNEIAIVNPEEENMKKRILIIWLSLLLGSLSMASQGFSLKIGLMQLSLDSDLWQINMENLAFDKQDMLDVLYGAEYEFYLGKILSVSIEGNITQKSIASQYKDWEHEDGTPIYQNLSLRITAFEAGVKLYPLGSGKRFYPFIGAGTGLYAWRYAQWGEFINFDDLTVQEGYAQTNTYSLGFNARAGMGFKFNPAFGVFLEAKYHYLKGQLSSFFEGFEKLDLSGFSANIGFTFTLR
jgi:hypothetical protein